MTNRSRVQLLCAGVLFLACSFADARESGVQITPDERQTLVNKDVGEERWAISLDSDTGTVTGNVYAEERDPVYLWCDEVARTDEQRTLDCYAANPCSEAPCTPDAWPFVRRVSVPSSFFEPPAPEPSVCGANATCGSDEYCDFPDDRCAGEGVCASVPDACTRELAPVCGCDGTTYPNRCEAARARANVAHEGECLDDELAVCGGRNDLVCKPDQYCQYGLGMCLLPDAEGECAPRPEAPCVCPLVIDPVCGCDGRSYDNSCQAACAGQSVATVGVCS